LHHAINTCQFPDISLDGQTAATGGFDSGACLLRRLPVNVCCRDRGSDLGVLQGNGTSHPPPGSRHQRDFFCQDHATPPRYTMLAAVDCASDNPERSDHILAWTWMSSRRRIALCTLRHPSWYNAVRKAHFATQAACRERNVMSVVETVVGSGKYTYE